MDKKERIQAAIHGMPVDRPPFSFWRHFPEIDHDPDALAEALLRFHDKFDPDFIKLMPSGVYFVEDWGCRVHYDGAPNGAKKCKEHFIKSPEDWRKLDHLNVDQGALGRELKCLRLVRKKVRDSAPILQTLFSPLTVAAKLAGPELLLQTLRNDPASLKVGLKTIAETMDQYIQACLDGGADGFFYATQMAVGNLLSPDEYQEFGATYDLPLLENIALRSSFSLLHIHGENILFRELSAYPVHAVNWHDRKTWPTLAQGQEIFSGAVAGGLEEWGVLLRGPASAIREQIQDAVAQTQGRRLMITPGCVLPIAIPEDFLFEARRAVESFKV